MLPHLRLWAVLAVCVDVFEVGTVFACACFYFLARQGLRLSWSAQALFSWPRVPSRPFNLNLSPTRRESGPTQIQESQPTRERKPHSISAMTTFATSATNNSTVPRPSPLAPPVTIATFPKSSFDTTIPFLSETARRSVANPSRPFAVAATHHRDPLVDTRAREAEACKKVPVSPIRNRFISDMLQLKVAGRMQGRGFPGSRGDSRLHLAPRQDARVNPYSEFSL